jgi:SAM-dependent methyltransferase
VAKCRSCPVCGQNQSNFLYKPEDSPGPVSQCCHCGMVYIADIESCHALIIDGPVVYGEPDPKLFSSSNLEDVKDTWEIKLLPDKEAEWPALQKNADVALQRIGKKIPSQTTDRKILDFGSGWGFFLAVAKERGWMTYGLEPIPASAVFSRATFGLDITNDVLREDTFPTNFFDVVTSFQVFEHLLFPLKELSYLHHMLRKGGIISIEVPNFDTWSMKIFKSRHRHFVQDHINFFSIKTLKIMLVNAGFEVIDQFHPTRHISVRYLFQYWFRRYLPKFFVNAFCNLLQRTIFWEKTIGLNFGDIVTVEGRKLD